MHRVHLDAGEAAALEEGGGLDDLVDLAADLVGGERWGRPVRCEGIGRGRRRETADGVAAEAEGELGEHLRAIDVQPLEQRDGAALEGLRSFQGPFAVERMDRIDQVVRVKGTGEDEPEAAAGAGFEIGERFVVERTVPIEQRGEGQRTDAESIFDGHGTDLQGAKEDIVSSRHGWDLLVFSCSHDNAIPPSLTNGGIRWQG